MPKFKNGMKSLAFMQLEPDRVGVGWGTFESAANRRPGRAAFYVNDFYLSDPLPWKYPEHFEEMSLEHFVQSFERTDSSLPVLQWQEPSFEKFQQVFQQLQNYFQQQQLHKAVPVVFETAPYEIAGNSLFLRLLSQLKNIPEHLLLYGYVQNSSGMIGATPEILFHQSDEISLTTMGLAGTRSLSEQKPFTEKEYQEHRLVVDDIIDCFQKYGEVLVQPRKTLALRDIEHLQTTLQVQLRRPLSFEECVLLLHPTAALGGVPRAAAQVWLREQRAFEQRDFFGAPFGLECADGQRYCMVAIRNVAWRDSHVRIGSGCGVTAQSDVHQEWAELHLKRASVKKLFGWA